MKISHKILFITAFISCTLSKGYAQLNVSQAMYFQNPYLYNPAMAGTENAMRLNFGYVQQWSGFQGTPRTAVATADWNPTGNVGVGLNINDDEAGLIRTTRVMGTYAYHLPLNEYGDKLSFGLNLGVNDSRVDYNRVKGDLSDDEIALYNQLKAYVDGDLGMAYKSNRLTFSAALPNLRSMFFQTSDQRFAADQLLFITMVSYRMDVSGSDGNLTLEPLAGFRKVRGYTDIVDAGLNLNFNNYGFFLQGIYHSSQSMALGVGLNQHSYMLNFSYNVQTGQLGNYASGSFEFGVKLRLFDK
jgi:type IX secretion system PorP/SprF family membrane protein